MYIGKNAGVAALIYCIFKHKLPEQAIAAYHGETSWYMPPDITDEMLNMYFSGMRVIDIAEMYDADISMVSKRLTRKLGMSTKKYAEISGIQRIPKEKPNKSCRYWGMEYPQECYIYYPHRCSQCDRYEKKEK